MRRCIVVGSQKLFLPFAQSVELAKSLNTALRADPLRLNVIVCPSVVSLAHVAEILRGSDVSVAAQVFHQECGGPFTGQMSLRDLRDLGVQCALIGHWETRDLLAETEVAMARKIQQCLAHGIAPLVCIGETREERDAGLAYDALARSLSTLFAPASGRPGVENITIAYEPRWSLPTEEEVDLRAAAKVLDATCAAIREMLADVFGPEPASHMSIVYGGGVTERSAPAVLEEFHGDGVLLGRASTGLQSFLTIARLVERFRLPAANPAAVSRH